MPTFKRSTRPIPYEVASAIRGFDNSEATSRSDIIKQEVTARLRMMYFSRSSHGMGDYNDTIMDGIAAERARQAILQMVSINPPGWRHWREHLMEAIYVTRKSRAWGGHAQELIGAL